MNQVKLICCSMVLIACSAQTLAQSVYVTTNAALGLLNLETCEYEEICTYAQPNTWTDVTIGADGTIYLIGGQYNDPPYTWDGAFIATLNPNNCVLTNVATIPDYAGTSMLLLPDGTFLVSCTFNGWTNSNNRYYIWDPITLTFTLIASVTPGPTPIGEFFIVAGQIYYYGLDFTSGAPSTRNIYQFDINTGASTLVTALPSPPRAMIAICDKIIAVNTLGGNPPLNEVNLNNGSQTLECNITGMNPNWIISGFGINPDDTTGTFCDDCISDASTFNGSSKSVCGTGDIDAGHNENEVLDPNDAIVFVLANSNNPGDLPGSILTTSLDDIFSFQPGITSLNTAYYVFALTGNTLNGTVDFADSCLSISPFVSLIWRSLPTVTFSAANPNVCAGACTSVTATFTGTAPFSLTYTTPASGTVTQTFSGNTGAFQVCTPPGSTPGSLVVQATKVVDGWCTCE